MVPLKIKYYLGICYAVIWRPNIGWFETKIVVTFTRPMEGCLSRESTTSITRLSSRNTRNVTKHRITWCTHLVAHVHIRMHGTSDEIVRAQNRCVSIIIFGVHKTHQLFPQTCNIEYHNLTTNVRCFTWWSRRNGIGCNKLINLWGHTSL